MKKAIRVAVIALLIIASLGREAFCDDALRKLGRGMSNVITCLLEVPLQISRVNNDAGPAAAATYGVVRGVAMTGMRVAVGAYEIVTFPIPLPGRYKPILKDPEFLLEEMEW